MHARQSFLALECISSTVHVFYTERSFLYGGERVQPQDLFEPSPRVHFGEGLGPSPFYGVHRPPSPILGATSTGRASANLKGPVPSLSPPPRCGVTPILIAHARTSTRIIVITVL